MSEDATFYVAPSLYSVFSVVACIYIFSCIFVTVVKCVFYNISKIHSNKYYNYEKSKINVA